MYLKAFEPLTENQAKFFEAYKRGDYFTMLCGSAGTGKSFIACYKAIEEVLDKTSSFHKVVIVRSAVQSRDLGFTPGSVEDKMSLYEQPYMQIYHTLFGRRDSYEALIRKMPGQFGAPAKVAVVEEDNKIKIKTLSYDTSGALTSIVSNTLLNNLAEYLSNYRMLNDYISVETAQVIDLSLEVSVVLDASQNQGAVISSIINKVSDYFNPAIRQLGQNVNISEINRIIQSENGVLSLTDLKVFNKVGGQYSSSETSMAYSDPATKQIGPVDNTIFALPNQIYQVRFPNKDITVKVKNFQTVSIS